MSDPVQAHFVAALTRRLQTAPEAVQRVLRERLQQTWPDHATEAPPSRLARTRAPSPLAQLNRDIAANAPPARELRSAQRFRDTWSRICAEDEVTQAVEQGPENAGPLNSHMLVLRTLALMRDLSPDYLRRFLSHTDTLLWLDQAQSQARTKPPAAKPKAARTKK
ncbi:hypothetical protein BSY239_731 [Hydrogenophaga sp. RAC07]|uniref:DUF2894 domain-containing protein n=1 Tax=Hydrogenophaga sp. RAC07 TaxID=1842537 RepID=UPI00083D70EB|nr:DUF2894 domain-containing protein [Hydrogenophaga sp. RAC07]AOF86199.1 hypothetical protein BSY239_731 [Hydrogenophaga sp. RAC07]